MLIYFVYCLVNSFKPQRNLHVIKAKRFCLFCTDNYSASSEEETRKEAVNIDTWLHRKDVVASFRCHQIMRNGYLTPRLVL